MRRALPTLLPWMLVLGTSTAMFVLLQWPEGRASGLMWRQPTGHFWVVSAASMTCLGIALVVSVAAIRTANARVVLLALSFLSMAGIFSVHGLTTPGFLLDAPANPTAVASAVSPAWPGTDYGSPSPGAGLVEATPGAPPRYLMVTGFSGRLALALAALFLGASAIPWPGRVERALVRWRRGVLGGAVGLIALYAWLALTQPDLVPAWLMQREAFAWGTLTLVTVCGVGAAVRFIVGYRRTGLALYAVVSLGALMQVQAAFSIHFGATWSGMFWLYHLQLLAGFAAILWDVLVTYSAGRTVESFEALMVTDVLQQLRSGYTESIVTLSAALEARDGYTLGHGERVAALAVLIGQEMRLPDHRLRALAAGALLHDAARSACRTRSCTSGLRWIPKSTT